MQNRSSRKSSCKSITPLQTMGHQICSAAEQNASTRCYGFVDSRGIRQHAQVNQGLALSTGTKSTSVLYR